MTVHHSCGLTVSCQEENEEARLRREQQRERGAMYSVRGDMEMGQGREHKMVYGNEGISQDYSLIPSRLRVQNVWSTAFF